MRIQHNIMAMNAYRNYNNNTSALSKNLERLSSGYKINRAGDDAAGLAISEKMRAQITGLTAAQKNVKDGISLINTAEGAMQEIQDMLNRMVSLATQSANGTYDNDVDRANLQKEVESLKAEINRIADSANFNGIKLLDGSLDTTTRNTTAEAVTSEDLILNEKTNDPLAVGEKTVLKGSGKQEAATKFDLHLQNLKVDGAKAGDTLSVKVGDKTITLKADDAADAVGTWDYDAGIFKVKTGSFEKTDELATAIAEAFNKMKTSTPGAGERTGAYIGGVKFTAKASGNTIAFEQDKEDNKYKDVKPNLDVEISYTASASAGAGGTTPTTPGGSAAATVSNASVGDATSPASFDVDVTLPASGTTNLSIGGQHFRIQGDGSQSLSEGGIASQDEISITEGDGTAASPYIIDRTGKSDKDVLDTIAAKLNEQASGAGITISGQTFKAEVSADGKKLTFKATNADGSPKNGALTGDDGSAVTADDFKTAIEAAVSISSSTSGNQPGSGEGQNPLGEVTVQLGWDGSATSATATIDLSTQLDGLSDDDVAGGNIIVGSTTYSWGTDNSGTAVTVTDSTLDGLKTALKDKIKSDAESTHTGFGGAWGTGDNANKLTMTATTSGSSTTAPNQVLGVNADVVAGRDSGTATAGTGGAELAMDNLEGGTLTIDDKVFFFSKYDSQTAADADTENDEAVPSGATVLYTGDYGDASTLANAINTAVQTSNGANFDISATAATGKVNIAITEKSGSEAQKSEDDFKNAISFAPKAASSSGGAAAAGIEIVRMSVSGHEDTATPSSVTGTKNSSINLNWADSTLDTTATPGSVSNAATTDGFAFDGTALETYINDNQIALGSGTSALAVKIGKISAGGQAEDGKLGLYVGTDLVGVAVDDSGAMVGFEATGGDGTAVTYKFAAISDHAVVSDTDLGTLTLKDDGSNAIANTAFDTAVATSSQITPGVDASTLKTVNASGLDGDAIKTAADAVEDIATGNITIELNSTSSKLELKIGNKVIGTSTENVDGTATTFNFTDSDGNSLGSVSAGTAPSTSEFTGALETGLTYTAAGPGDPQPPVVDGGNDTDTDAGDTVAVSSGKLTVEGVDFSEEHKNEVLTETTLKAVQNAFQSVGAGGKILVNGDFSVDLSEVAKDFSITTKVGDVATAVFNAAKKAAEDWNTANSTTAGYKYTNIRVATTPTGDDGSGNTTVVAHDGATTSNNSLYILADVEALENTSGGKLTGSYNVNTTQNVEGVSSASDVLASTIITEDKMKGIVQDGTVLTIGKESYIFKTKEDSVVTDDGNGYHEISDDVKIKIIDVSNVEEADQATEAMRILGSKDFAENSVFTIGYESAESGDNRLSIHETKGALTDSAEDKKIAELLKDLKGFQSLVTSKSHVTATSEPVNESAKALRLQIGDTSDDFNQLKVGIGDMHVNAMHGLKRDNDGNLVRDAFGNTFVDSESTIEGIDISSQDGAKKAINIIKDAINYVSSVRGDLGAISNRLDHTANNLSVMAENITDAESTIRDTDIAEEMMAYTKNNILVQSAQAMLAQANQVPQGVLQLLQ